jgi:hypothetical protein
MQILAMWHALPVRPSFAATALVALGACTTTAGPKYPDLNSFCNGQASAECSSEVVLACAVPSTATCVANRQQVCVAAAPAGAIYNPAPTENCIAVVSGAYSDAKLTIAESSAISAACSIVFDGPGGPDAACQQDPDCKVSTGLRCVPKPGSNMGTCQIPQPVQGGGMCVAADAQCVAGFHCGLSSHCDIDGMANDPCDAADPCAPGFMCSTAATCTAKSADGTACASADECMNGICNKASGAAMGLCVSEVTLAPDEPFCVDSR